MHWNDSIAISTALFFGLCGAAFLPMYVGALYIKKLTKTAAISGMIAGFSSSLLWMMFVHTKEAAAMRICKALFGTNTLVGETSIWQFVDPIIIALSISILVTVIVQIVSKKEFSKQHLDECFDGIKQK